MAFDFKVITNTSVELRVGHIPPSPALRTPPQLTPQGEIKQPEPEKSFLQKYWIFIAGIVIALRTLSCRTVHETSSNISFILDSHCTRSRGARLRERRKRGC
jgi:hypothetical protein